MGSIDKALPHAGFYPDSQNFHSDAAKIDIIIETSKFSGSFFLSLHVLVQKRLHFSKESSLFLPLILKRITHQGQIL